MLPASVAAGREPAARLGPQQALIVSADDFGLSHGVNEAVRQAHCHGVLTNASLMVNGSAFEEAVDIAHSLPSMGVGLHLVLLQGRATLTELDLPGLISREGFFRQDPVRTGLLYFFAKRLRDQLEREIRAQLEKFLASGLALSHVDGHLNIHVHPTVLSILVSVAAEYGIRALRLPREPLRLSLRANHSQLLRKVVESLTFRALCRHAARRLDEHRIAYPDQLFGLHHSGHMTESYLRVMTESLPPGVTEIYTHASRVDDEAARWRPRDYECEGELQALLSAQLKQQIQDRGIALITYRDLPRLRGAEQNETRSPSQATLLR